MLSNPLHSVPSFFLVNENQYMYLLFFCCFRANHCEHKMNEAHQEMMVEKKEKKNLEEMLEKLRNERNAFEKDLKERENIFENERREYQQRLNKMDVNEKALTAHLKKANREIEDLNFEKQKLIKERDDMRDR